MQQEFKFRTKYMYVTLTGICVMCAGSCNCAACPQAPYNRMCLAANRIKVQVLLQIKKSRSKEHACPSYVGCQLNRQRKDMQLQGARVAPIMRNNGNGLK
eukprot:scaffold20559_cov15-Tisochrysis_lutea.AAC.1